MNLYGIPGFTAQPMEVLGFLSVDGGPRGIEMLQQFHRALTYLALFHYPLDSSGEISGSPDQTLIDTVHSYGLDALLVLSNFTGKQFNPYIMRTVLTYQDVRQNLLQNLTYLLDNHQLDGVNLDLENMFPEDRNLFSAFLGSLASTLHGRGKLVTISVPALLRDEPQAHWKGAFDYGAIGQVVDRVVLMTYEEHWPASEPGPIASIPWVTGVVNYATSKISPDKLYLGLPLYGYDWALDGSLGKSITYRLAMELLSRYGAQLEWDDVAQVPHFSYTDSQGMGHSVWFENVRSVAAKVNLARQFGLKGLAIWEMKLTFPEFWQYIVNNIQVVKP